MQMVRINTIVLITVTLTGLIACVGQQAQHNKRLSEAARGIGEAYMRQGDFSAALAKLLEAEKLNPEDHHVQHDLALCYRAKKMMDKALDHLKKAVALKPNYAIARNTLGRVYIETGQLDLAIATLKEITRDALYATPHFALSNLGDAYFLKQDFGRAIEYFRQALKIQPDFVPALHGLGRTYVAMARGKLALVYLEKALSLAPNTAQIHLDAAEAYEQMGRLQQAIASYQSVVDLAVPESDMVREAKMRLRVLR